jgi:hypothetical protein
MYGSSVRISEQRSAAARKEANKLACEAWNKRMLGFRDRGAAVADARRCAQCRIRLPRGAVPRLRDPPDRRARHHPTTPIHELERYMRCKDCSKVRGYAYKRSHLVSLQTTKISASDHHRPGGRENAKVGIGSGGDCSSQ